MTNSAMKMTFVQHHDLVKLNGASAVGWRFIKSGLFGVTYVLLFLVMFYLFGQLAPDLAANRLFRYLITAVAVPVAVFVIFTPIRGDMKKLFGRRNENGRD